MSLDPRPPRLPLETRNSCGRVDLVVGLGGIGRTRLRHYLVPDETTYGSGLEVPMSCGRTDPLSDSVGVAKTRL